MENQSPLSQIPERDLKMIEGILARAHNNPNANEAAVAASMAVKILQKFNLSVAEFEASAVRTDESKVEADYFPLDDISGMPTWLAILSNSIGKACFCRPIVSGPYMAFLGRKREADIARMIFIDLYTQMKLNVVLAKDAYAKEFERVHHHSPWESAYAGKKKMKRDFIKSWMDGCARGIAQALFDQRKQFESSGGSALLIVRDTELDKWMQDHSTGVKKARGHDMNQSAFSSGFEKGKELGSSAGRPKLGE